MMNYKISIIVPVYKVEAYLDECISSLVNQTYFNLEIILIDDGSPDNCPLICDGWAERDSRIKVIHKKNEGQSKARNVGLNIATGDYIGFVDSDDWIAPEMYEKLLQGFHNDTISITSCNVLSVRGEKKEPWVSSWKVEKERLISYSDYARKLLTMEANFTMWSKLYRRDLFEKVRFREGRLNEDSLLVFDLSQILNEHRWNMLEIPFEGYFYRQRENSSTNDLQAPLEMEVLRNYKEMGEISKSYDTQLSKKLIQYKNYRLYLFLFKIIYNTSLHPLFNRYYSEFKKISIFDMIHANHLRGKGLLRFFILRYYPHYYLNHNR